MASATLEAGQSLCDAPALEVPQPITLDARRPLLDMVRLTVATFVIVIHTIESPSLIPLRAMGSFSTPFFAAAAMVFLFNGIRRDPSRQWGHYVGNRFRRLYIPFLAWGIIYLGLRNIKHVLLTDGAPVMVNWALFWTGPVHHLWFLPFILVFGALFFPVAHWVSRNRNAAWAVAAAAILAGTVIWLLPGISYKFNPSDDTAAATRYLILRCWDRLPALLWGVAIGCLVIHHGQGWVFRPWLAVLGGILAVGCIAWAVTHDTNRQLQNVGGVGFLFLGMAPIRMRPRPLLQRLGHLSFGVYLTHVVFVEGSQAVFHAAGLGIHWWLDLFNIAGALFTGILITRMIDPTRWLRWLIP